MTSRRGESQIVVGLLVAAILAAGLVTVAIRTAPHRGRVAALPTPTASPTAKAPRPVATRKPTPKPQPVRTYSAPPSGGPVTGRVVDVNGRPVAGATVRLTAHEGFFEGFARALTAVASLGLACLADVCTVPYGVGQTGNDGRYTVYLEGVVDDYDVVVEAGTGQRFSVRIDFAGKPLRLPDVVWWAPAPRLVIDGTRAVVRYATPPARLGAWGGTSATVSIGEDTLYLGTLRSGDSFDARLVEDLTATLDVSYSIRTKLGPASYSGRSVPVRGRLRAVSRGRPCYEYDARGRRVTNTPCPLTDGNLFTEWHPKVPDYPCKQGSECERRVTVDLGSVRRLHYVAVRTCDDFFDSVEVSADGSRWTTVIDQHSGQGGDVQDVCARALDVSARYVRVTGPTGGFYTRRSEISVF